MTATRVCGSLTALALAFAAFAAPNSWPSDDARIVFGGFAGDGTAIYVTTPDGAWFEALTEPGAGGSYPAWSHDGRTIAFSSGVGGVSRLYLMDADGRHVRRISDGPRDFGPTWSPRDDAIVFTSSRKGNGGIYMADLDGGRQTLITGVDTVAQEPSWRPAGDAIAYSESSHTTGFSDIHIMDSEGLHLAQLTDRRPHDLSADWHPRGKAIAFVSWGEDDRSADIYTMKPDGADERRLTTHPARDTDPRWSPDGTQILFTSARDGDDGLFIMDLDGRIVRKVTDEQFTFVQGSSWFDPAVPLGASAVGQRAAMWGWLKRLGAAGS
ncbi:hypothetical protein HN371_13205 [Candidatus Poribacteria bacterium]|jgi:TolB protein|nr:hypothetical protein [Candidatus Poribacteria bacterium]MBT5533848.1 hypothetical protein [Candidatus Poribacteria bacterium]MBT5712718.1 hypothetical protein [Candidatus Poribacteria bacterium]MBT7097945.1 hypothetical protein [Candidatus Poribacteria bacterium]MBT7807830.1 hypothetical protein [Candidatus Poribacteria bacterium]